MILKESKLRQNFLKYSKEFLNTKQNKMTIGLEMELQQDSSLTDEIFSLESNPELTVIIMVEETKRHLTTNTKPDIYFFATKVDGEIEMDMLIDQFTEYDNKFYPHLNKYKNEYIIEFLNWEQDLDPSYICSDINHFFLEQYSEYGEHRDEWDDLRRKFYGTADWWKGKYSIEEILEFTEDNFDQDINKLIEEKCEEEGEDYEEIIEKTNIIEYKLSLFAEKPSNNKGFEERKENIREYFNNNPKLYERYINKYGLEMVNEYQPNSKHSYFSVEDDSSLEPNDKYNTTFEFKTPFGMTLNEQLDFFEQFLKNEENQGYQLMPNDSCGLHVNISIDEQDFNVNYLDYIILFILFNEKKLKLNTRGGDIDTIFKFQEDIQEEILNNVKIYLTKNLKTFVEEYNNFKLLKDEKIEEFKNKGMTDSEIENKVKKYSRKRSIFLLKEILEVFNEQIKQVMQSRKYLSMTKKEDRIEFRIMGGDYLKEQVKTYILEVQSTFQQQYYQPEELKRECYRKQMSKILKYEPVNISISNIIGNKVEIDLKSLIDLEMINFQWYYSTIRKYINFINSIEKDQDKVDNLTDQERIQEVMNEWQKMFKEDILEYFKSSNIYDNKKFNLFLTILNEDITSEDIKRNKYKQVLHDWMDRLMILYQLNYDFNKFKKGINKKYREIIQNKNKNIKDNDVEKIMDI